MRGLAVKGSNRFVILGALCALIVFGIVITAAKAQAPAVSSSSKKADEQFKNIQVLKGVPADQLIPAMQFITASLGVECDFCHVQGAFDKDDKKPKKIARDMMQMMFAINKDNFNGHREVTCYTCHRGSNDPVGTPIIGEEAKAMPPMPKHEEEEKKPTGPTADELIEKYVQALGGARAVDKVNSFVATGTIDFGGTSYGIDVYAKDGKRASFVHMPQGDNITAFNGQEGWLGAPGRPVREMHGPDIDGAAMDADLHLATHLKSMFSEAEVRGTEKIGDHDTYFVFGRREGKPPMRLYFDKQSGLLVRLVRYAETPLGRLPTQIDYADYKEISGLKVPYKWTLARPGGQFTIQAKEIKENVSVDEAKFAKPAGPAPEPPK